MRLLPFLKHNKDVLLYSVALAGLLLVLKWLQYKFLLQTNTTEIYIGIIALLFTIIGVWAGGKIVKPKTTIQIVKEEVTIVQSHFDADLAKSQQEHYGITKRELEILQLIAQGMSNDEIAKTLFISVSSVKTLISRLFSKLNVERRTQAIQKAKEIGLIA
ncbi:MAG: LuxR C-terminal-related transcriptional regulator [Chitinophagales bacterium]|jgi:DNA-binding CsgD family transcriptional regulator|nr:DNA-binding response regulator [Bacteroidota bacterium]MBL0281264.1 DNA-binding response regulator [Bacteroidota bacterium]MBP8250104.1 hypothetical protein [Chitinophagales bacterium]MBP9881162.1 hypothetical protein [Chitinophagales bacterium]